MSCLKLSSGEAVIWPGGQAELLHAAAAPSARPLPSLVRGAPANYVAFHALAVACHDTRELTMQGRAAPLRGTGPQVGASFVDLPTTTDPDKGGQEV